MIQPIAKGIMAALYIIIEIIYGIGIGNTCILLCNVMYHLDFIFEMETKSF